MNCILSKYSHVNIDADHFFCPNFNCKTGVTLKLAAWTLTKVQPRKTEKTDSINYMKCIFFFCNNTNKLILGLETSKLVFRNEMCPHKPCPH